MTRELFERKLRELKDEVLVMGSMVEKALHRSVEALRTRDIDLSNQVVADDMAINAKRYELEEQCIHVQQDTELTAADLRELVRQVAGLPLALHLASGYLRCGVTNGVVALGLRRDGLALSEPEIHDALQQARDIVLAGLCAPSARDASGAPLAQLHTVASPSASSPSS